jgi:hypothetical protein
VATSQVDEGHGDCTVFSEWAHRKLYRHAGLNALLVRKAVALMPTHRVVFGCQYILAYKIPPLLPAIT